MDKVLFNEWFDMSSPDCFRIFVETIKNNMLIPEGITPPAVERGEDDVATMIVQAVQGYVELRELVDSGVLGFQDVEPVKSGCGGNCGCHG